MLARRIGGERVCGKAGGGRRDRFRVLGVSAGPPDGGRPADHPPETSPSAIWPMSFGAPRIRCRAIEAGQHGSEIRSSLSWTYSLLNPEAARLFTVLGVHPDFDIDAERAAHTAGTTTEAARALLGELASVSVVSEYAPGRYMMHGLTRAYAADLFQLERSAAPEPSRLTSYAARRCGPCGSDRPSSAARPARPVDLGTVRSA